MFRLSSNTAIIGRGKKLRVLIFSKQIESLVREIADLQRKPVTKLPDPKIELMKSLVPRDVIRSVS